MVAAAAGFSTGWMLCCFCHPTNRVKPLTEKRASRQSRFGQSPKVILFGTAVAGRQRTDAKIIRQQKLQLKLRMRIVLRSFNYTEVVHQVQQKWIQGKKIYISNRVLNIFLMYSPDGPNVYGARMGSSRALGRCRGLKVVKLCSQKGTYLHILAVGCIIQLGTNFPNFSKFCGPVSPILQLANIVINLLWPLNPTKYANIYCWQLQLTDTVCLPNKLAISEISSAHYPTALEPWQWTVAVVLFHDTIMSTYTN